jgi:hypothetical protein
MQLSKIFIFNSLYNLNRDNRFLLIYCETIRPVILILSSIDMNSEVIKTCLFLISGLFLSYHSVIAQENQTFPPDSSDLFLLVEKEYGPDPVLINGLYPEDYILDAIGHPFFKDTLFHRGYVVVHNQKFDNVSLQYNIFDQNIIVSQSVKGSTSLMVIPPDKFISEFRFDDKVFRKLSFNGVGEDFYQVVYDGKIKCLFSFAKKRYVSYHNQKYSSYTFTKDLRKMYLLIDQKFIEFEKAGSFFKCFPEKARPEIKAYCKNKKIRFSRSSEQEIAKLVEFCETGIRAN